MEKAAFLTLDPVTYLCDRSRDSTALVQAELTAAEEVPEVLGPLRRAMLNTANLTILKPILAQAPSMRARAVLAEIVTRRQVAMEAALFG